MPTIDEDSYLEHYGTPRHSGRYPWGSGGEHGESLQRSMSFLDSVDELKRKGMSEVDIAQSFKMTTSQLRAEKSLAINAERQAKIGMASRLKEKGLSTTAIGERMGVPESSVRQLLAPTQKLRADVLQTTANMLKDNVEDKKYIDVGAGVEHQVGVSRTKLNTAIKHLEANGYKLQYVKVRQLGTGKETSIKVLTKADVPYSELTRNRADIRQITEYSNDGGHSYLKIEPPLSIDSKRVGIKYAEDEGKKSDGLIEVRPGVHDITLDGAAYAQVRVAVDGTHYLKGVAVYNNKLPTGTDILFHTNKSDTGNKLDAMKPMKTIKVDGKEVIDKDNPFTSSIKRQIGVIPGKNDSRPTSVMNLVNEEGDWDKWSKNLSTQVLSKQSPDLAKKQLDLTYKTKLDELDEITSLTNPTVRRKLLESFADGADSSAVHLRAAALPRQSNKVIIPINSLKDHEVYAPSFDNGERVVLIRHPHGGKFEIPELTVNNKNKQARETLGTSPIDAIGINHKVAERLSGADFDGDTVIVVPNNHGKIKSAPALERLKDFDAKIEYAGYDGMHKMTKAGTQQHMGTITNLIADMSIKGAPLNEISQAVRHSMVVIDAEKHGLDYRRSAMDHGILALKKKYQNNSKGLGASTLISRAESELHVDARKPRSAAKGGAIDPVTGKLMFEPDTRRTKVDDKGNVVFLKDKTTKLAEASDAHTLSSGTAIEKVYADHSNRLKSLANQARREMVATKSIPYSPSAHKVYAKEVERLTAALKIAERNAPLERRAQLVGNSVLKQMTQANPDMDKDELKTLKFKVLEEARHRVGAGKEKIKISPSEWEAIQAGAISNDRLSKILNNVDDKDIKQLATPRTTATITPTKRQLAKTLLAAGYTQAEVANRFGVSVSTLNNSL